jgi:hypothetical protein
MKRIRLLLLLTVMSLFIASTGSSLRHTSVRADSSGPDDGVEGTKSSTCTWVCGLPIFNCLCLPEP